MLAIDLDPHEGVLIYPEGTRSTPAKLARAKEIIRERQPDIAPLADRLQHVLPPRLGGPLALLESSARHRRGLLRPRRPRRLREDLRHLGAAAWSARTVQRALLALPGRRGPDRPRGARRAGSTSAGRCSTTGSASSAGSAELRSGAAVPRMRAGDAPVAYRGRGGPIRGVLSGPATPMKTTIS